MLLSKWEQPENEIKLCNAVRNNTSVAGALRSLGLRPTGANYNTMHHHITRLQLDISHHKGQGWAKDYRIEKDSYKNRQSLRRRVIEERGYKCEICSLSDWQGQSLTLELDHINGINNDNRFENVRLLCPNCHSQTTTYRSKNRKGS